MRQVHSNTFCHALTPAFGQSAPSCLACSACGLAACSQLPGLFGVLPASLPAELRTPVLLRFSCVWCTPLAKVAETHRNTRSGRPSLCFLRFSSGFPALPAHWLSAVARWLSAAALSSCRCCLAAAQPYQHVPLPYTALALLQESRYASSCLHSLAQFSRLLLRFWRTSSREPFQ